MSEVIRSQTRESPDIKFKEFPLTKQKLDLKRTMSELGKPFPKESEQKFKKLEINVKMPHMNKKLQARKQIFVQTPSSHYFKIRVKFHAAKPLAFSLHLLFRRDQKSLFQFDFKHHENV